MIYGASSLGGNPAFAQAFGITRPPITSFAIVSGYFESLQILLELNQSLFACGISAAHLGRGRKRTFKFKNLEHGQLPSRAYPIRRPNPRRGPIARSSSRSGFGPFFQSKKLKATFANRLFDIVSRDFVRQVLIWRNGSPLHATA
jgi:hypothetical protein